jgi:protease-4
MEVLHRRFQFIAEADNVKGVIIVLGGITAGIATLQSLRSAVKRLQDAGKDVVIYSPMLDLSHYFVAVSADRIVIPPSAFFDVLGLHADAVFLKDALNNLGIEAEVIQISPYKTGFDNMSKSDMSVEYREQIEWILDETFGYIVSAIATGRDKTTEEVIDIVNHAPYSAAEAQELGLVDDVAYEDMIAFLLAENSNDLQASETPLEGDKVRETKIKKRAKLASWPRASRVMLRHFRRPVREYVGVVSIEGLITPGPSRKPPFTMPLPIPFMGSETAGDETVLQMIRLAERDRQLAALVIFINSPGGVHLSSDMMWRQIERFATKKPVVCVFGDVAASGGYYIATPSTYIIAPELSITGSIGVYTAHVSTRDLYKRLNINRVMVSRGERSLLRSDAAPLDDDRREVLWDGISHAYNQFKKVVADGREIEMDQLDDISGGRIWTGRQALQHGLVDGHGDFIDALNKAAELAGLPLDANHRVDAVNIYPRGRSYLLPMAYEQMDEIAASFSVNRMLDYFNRPLAMLPFNIRFW